MTEVPRRRFTSVFDSSHYFSARGIGATRRGAESSFYAFAGTTSTWMGTGFFNAAQSNNPVGIFFYERKLGKRLKFFSRDIFSNRQTFLQGVEYRANRSLKASLTGGNGSNQKYFAAGIDAETQKLALKASYVITGDRFRRVAVISPMSSAHGRTDHVRLWRRFHQQSPAAARRLSECLSAVPSEPSF